MKQVIGVPKELKTCRICGRKYEACRTPNTSKAFRWQDVSCSPECGAEYLRKVQIARGLISPTVAESVTEQKAPNDDKSLETEIHYNEDFNGFDGEPEEEYLYEFGADD